MYIRENAYPSRRSWLSRRRGCALSIHPYVYLSIYLRSVTGVTTASSGTASSGTSARHSSDSRV